MKKEDYNPKGRIPTRHERARKQLDYLIKEGIPPKQAVQKVFKEMGILLNEPV